MKTDQPTSIAGALMAALFCIPALTAQPHCEVNVRLLAGQHFDVGDVIVSDNADWLISVRMDRTLCSKN